MPMGTTKEGTTMSVRKRWTMEILLEEHPAGGARAVARLDTSEDAHLHGEGVCSVAVDPDVDGGSGPAADRAVCMALSQIVATLSARAARAERSLDLHAAEELSV
jgi:hypothetical protein